MTQPQTCPELLDWAVKLNALADALSVPDGGFTINPVTGADVHGGYAVGIHPHLTTAHAEVTSGTLLEFLLSNADTLALPDRVFGGWRDPSDGRIYLDVSMLFEDQATALEWARHFDQLAVYDFAAGRSIPSYPEASN